MRVSRSEPHCHGAGALTHMDYNRYHAECANLHQPVAEKRVLVVGCNTGADCAYFVEFGAKEVHGLDVVEEVGRDFQHERVVYHRASAEGTGLPSARFDLVFCFATMEHVPDIAAAFSEMARVIAPSGLIYSVASPLWNSRHGHHFPQYFAEIPWAHLRMTQSEVLAYLQASGQAIAPEQGSACQVAKYMFDRANFNMTPAAAYVDFCGKLKGFEFLRNDLDLEPEGSVPVEILDELITRGYTDTELRAVTHTLIARRLKKRWYSW